MKTKNSARYDMPETVWGVGVVYALIFYCVCISFAL